MSCVAGALAAVYLCWDVHPVWHEEGMSDGTALPNSCSSLLQVKGHRRITFDQFINALSHIGEKKQCQLGEVATAVLSNNGPAVSGTRADYVKLFDDKSTYTGVHVGCYRAWQQQNKDPACVHRACCFIQRRRLLVLRCVLSLCLCCCLRWMLDTFLTPNAALL